MPEDKDLLTAKEFARLAGVKPGTITKWLRSGKLEGTKSGGRWMIPRSQLANLTAKTQPEPEPSRPSSGQTDGQSAGQDGARLYSIEEFAAMTYLTELGVERWIKAERLIGRLDSSGNWKVDSSSLRLPHIKHLLRD